MVLIGVLFERLLDVFLTFSWTFALAFSLSALDAAGGGVQAEGEGEGPGDKGHAGPRERDGSGSLVAGRFVGCGSRAVIEEMSAVATG